MLNRTMSSNLNTCQVPIILEKEEQDPTESFFISPFSKETRITITDNVVRPKKVDEFLSIILTQYVFGKGEIEEMSSIVKGDKAMILEI